MTDQQNPNRPRLVVQALAPEHLRAQNQITLDQWLAALRGYHADAQQPTTSLPADRLAA